MCAEFFFKRQSLLFEINLQTWLTLTPIFSKLIINQVLFLFLCESFQQKESNKQTNKQTNNSVKYVSLRYS